MRTWYTPLLLVLILGSAAVGWSRLTQRTPDDLLLSAGQVQELTDLTTLRVPVTEVVVLEKPGPFRLGSTRAMIAVQGDALLATSITANGFEQIDEAARSAVLRLKTPSVTQAIIDHGRSEVYSLDRTGLWVLAFWSDAERELVNEAFREAQAKIVSAGSQPHYLRQARVHTEQAVAAWFAQLGWSVQVRWAEQ